MISLEPGQGHGVPKPKAGSQLFPIGQVVATPGALANITESEMFEALNRHVRGDWGDLDMEDIQSNNHALQVGDRLLSAYHTSGGTKFWIITEADRSSTTVLLPEEY